MTETSLPDIDHVGATVPDIEAAATFLIEELGAQVIYQPFSDDQPPQGSAEPDRDLNLLPGRQRVAARVIQIGNGPEIELFQLRSDEQRPASGPATPV